MVLFKTFVLLALAVSLAEPKECKNGGVVMPIRSVDYCICQKNFYGDECEIYLNNLSQEEKHKFGCALRPCWLGSTCEDLTHLNGTFRCHCSANTYGEFCEKTSYEKNDPCKTNPCYNDGVCENLDDNSYRCLCANSSFGGTSCRKSTLGGCSYSSAVCQRDSMCVAIGDNDYKCNCQDWTIGKDCELVFNPCQYVTCPNSGVCLKRRTLAYECKCAEGYMGYLCNQRVNESCLKQKCQNDATCELDELTGEYYCKCKTNGFSGEYCEIENCNPKCVRGICKRNELGIDYCECESGRTGPSCSDLTCFSGDMLVEAQNGGYLKISQLKYGDMVKTYDDVSGTVKYTKVLTYLHKNDEISTKYILLKTSTNQTIKISSKHLIAAKLTHTSPIDYVFAETLKVNDQLIDSTITQIAIVSEKGAYAPLTEDGTLYVNNILVSCYANIKSHKVAHFAMKPLMLMSKYSQSVLDLNQNTQNDDILWYAKLLYQLVMSTPTQISSLII